MISTVTVYFNTGFNGIDIPASPDVLANARSITYQNPYFIREDIDKPQIRIADTYENLCAVDYCAITTSQGTSYFFASPRSLSKGVTILSLDLDALLTMGGASQLTYTGGWQERGHIAKADDTLFSNVATEDWRPSQPLETRNMTKLQMTSEVENDLDVVISNIDIGGLGVDSGVDAQSVIEGLDRGGNPKMYFPFIKTPVAATGFFMYDYEASQLMQFTIPNTAAYESSNTTVKNGLQKLFSCGQLQLQASYKIPKEYVESFTIGSDGRYTNITGGHASITLNDLPFIYTQGNYTPKNKKVYATFRSYSICNVGSGDLNSKEAENLYDGSATSPTVNLWADMCSTGKPYARFGYIKGSPIQFSDCVRGLQWANSQIVMEGASGSVWNSMNNAFANAEIQRQQSMATYNLSMGTANRALSMEQLSNDLNYGLAQNAVQAGTTLPELFMGSNADRAKGGVKLLNQGLGMMQTAQNAQIQMQRTQLEQNAAQAQYDSDSLARQMQINQNNIGLIQSNQVVAPTVSFTPEQNLGLYGYNYFVVYETRKSLDDLKSEDMYYQKYGYNGLHRPLTQQCFKERQYYSYVQAFDVNLKSPVKEFGIRVRTKAIAQLNKGVRVWKVLPDASYYELN